MPLFDAALPLSLFVVLSGDAVEVGEVGSVGLPAAGGVAPVESRDVGDTGEVPGVSIGGVGVVEVPVDGVDDVPGAVEVPVDGVDDVPGAVDVPVCGVVEPEGEVEVPPEEEGGADEEGACWAIAALASIAEKTSDARRVTLIEELVIENASPGKFPQYSDGSPAEMGAHPYRFPPSDQIELHSANSTHAKGPAR